LHWPLGIALAAVWLTMAFGFRISSLAALTTAVLMPLGLFYARGPGPEAWAGVAIALLLFWRHRANIRQLISGGERTIGQ
jgi:acyl phosphate:glycerol-3-phosphate acyltransferase